MGVLALAVLWVNTLLVAGASLQSLLAGERRGQTIVAAVLATSDPRAWCARRIGLLAGFIVAILVAASACTALALATPRFGLVSTIGAGLGLAYFLGVQPIATQVRDWVR